MNAPGWLWDLPAFQRRAIRAAKRTAVGVAGAGLVAMGGAMLVLPGPGLLVIIAGLAVLATEFAWAEHRLHQVCTAARDAADRARRRRPEPKERP